jgi:hypothetical protein
MGVSGQQILHRIREFGFREKIFVPTSRGTSYFDDPYQGYRGSRLVEPTSPVGLFAALPVPVGK